MNVLKTRVDRLEAAAGTQGITDPTNLRLATDAQLEAYLRSHGIDPSDEMALHRAATGQSYR